jgi:hypothetical protein
MFSFKLDDLIIHHNGDDLIDVAYNRGYLSNFTTGKIWQKSLENMTSLPPNGSFESQRAFRDLSTALTHFYGSLRSCPKQSVLRI